MARTKVPQPDAGASQQPPQPLPDRQQFVAPGAYDPFEIVDLMTALYELYLKMRYITPSSLKYPPHSPPVDVSLAKSLGVEPQVIAILQLLPYVEGRGSEDNFFQWGGFADYREGRNLEQMLCDPLYRSPDKSKGSEEEKGPYVKPWVLPLNACGNRGTVLFFDTRNGHITAVSVYGECSDPAFYGKRKEIPQDASANQNSIAGVPSRPAKQFFRDTTVRLYTLEWIPFSNLIVQEEDAEHSNLELLFRNYGWPSDFDPEAFDQAAKRYKEFRKVSYQLGEPKRQLGSAERAVKLWRKQVEDYSARRVREVWDNDPDKPPEQVAELERELKSKQDDLDLVETHLAEVKEKLQRREGRDEMEVAWQEFLEGQIQWLQRNIDYDNKAEDMDSVSAKLKEEEAQKERLKERLKDVKSLPKTMKEAIQPGGGPCIGLGW